MVLELLAWVMGIILLIARVYDVSLRTFLFIKFKKKYILTDEKLDEITKEIHCHKSH